MKTRAIVLLIAVLASGAALADTGAIVPPQAVKTEGVPSIPNTVATATRPYLEARQAVFLGWDAAGKRALIKTRFGSTDQIHVVARPAGAREQLTFQTEPVPFGTYAPAGAKDPLVVQMDKGGDEFFQLYRVEDGQLVLLTDGKSRNWFGAWGHNGDVLGYASSRRNGRDMDLYAMNPMDPSSDRLIAKVSGGGWNLTDFSKDGRSALAVNRISINRGVVSEVNLATGVLRQITPSRNTSSFGDARYAADGGIWVLSDHKSDFVQLGKLDARTGAFTPVSHEPKWDITDYAVAPDGSFVAYVVNDNGVSRLRVMDGSGTRVRTVDGLPNGVLDWSFGRPMQISSTGEIGLSMSSARVTGDVFSVDPGTLKVTRWTRSEAGGLDLERNSEPELITVKSFDGTEISGFLYRPDPARFNGKRPLIIDIHGGPEGQARPRYLGEENYLINELGIAVFLPNVRGSSGFGKRFLDLDNGPWKREDSVKDIGAFIDALAGDSRLDAARFSVYGFSYGGYMCYASAVHFSAKLKSASCAVGISNFVTFLEHTQPYRQDLRRVEYGDERDAKQRSKLEEISPLHNVADISIPIMVAAGGNDPRVPASEAAQIASAVREHGGTVWYVLATNEGHGFHKRENHDFMFWTQVEFWKQTLLK